MDDKPPPYSPSAPYLANAGPAYPSAYQAPYPPAVPPQSGVPYAPYPPPVGFVAPGGPNYMPHAPPQSGVYTQQPTAPPVTVVHFGRHPVLVTCPYCRNHGMTSVHPESGCLAWLLCALFCVFGLWCGCCLIPFCIDSVKNVTHMCAVCRRRIGHYAPL